MPNSSSSDDRGNRTEASGAQPAFDPPTVQLNAVTGDEPPLRMDNALLDEDMQALMGAELAALEREATGDGDPEADAGPEPTLLEQMGGISGLIYSSLPVLVFVPVNSLRGLTAAIWASLGVAAAILVWRLVRRDPIQPAISGFLGVGVCAFIAYRMGEAKGFFLFGIYASLIYGGAFLMSLVVRWPLAGVIWGALNGHGTGWRSDKRAMRLYDIATAVWAVVFVARYLVQNHLYDSNSTGLLAVARIAMGWPLTAVAALVTFWAVRKAGHLPSQSAKARDSAA
ncbi:hypothetical protein NS506_05867 [Nocardia seriolae]|uniref:Membrane protein n=2 Tax=Nocardia seriolae TaxID=37332 RepID=A0ABC9YUU5_9NOCA|nr:hypothetical protein NS506_05867 [Nocardia seriolae]BAW08165.1 membrane protein [Nocardia seriolae]BEK89590.1 hypothetical protein NSERKGN1266_55410 [Nocardia seriolae]BEK94791.1 hypothetical protein NSER024013_26970 [Nocardia seriolae]GAM47210.1 membrane protein [Nocardia seriolae]